MSEQQEQQPGRKPLKRVTLTVYEDGTWSGEQQTFDPDGVPLTRRELGLATKTLHVCFRDTLAAFCQRRRERMQQEPVAAGAADGT